MTIHELLVVCRNHWSKKDIFGYDPDFLITIRVIPSFYCKPEEEKNYSFRGNLFDYDEYNAICDYKVANWIFEDMQHIHIVVVLDSTIL